MMTAEQTEKARSLVHELLTLMWKRASRTDIDASFAKADMETSEQTVAILQATIDQLELAPPSRAGFRDRADLRAYAKRLMVEALMLGKAHWIADQVIDGVPRDEIQVWAFEGEEDAIVESVSHGLQQVDEILERLHGDPEGFGKNATARHEVK